MARAIWRNKFDRDRDFVVRRMVTVQGQTFGPGNAFDKTLVTTRRLRQLYDQRVIMFSGDTPGAIIPKAAVPKRTSAERKPNGNGTDKTPPADHRSAIEIPADWADIAWPDRLALAKKLTEETVRSGHQVRAIIEAELARRGATS
jgi:hypothetical protein